MSCTPCQAVVNWALFASSALGQPPAQTHWVGATTVAGRSLVIQAQLPSGDGPGKLDVVSEDVMGLATEVTRSAPAGVRVHCPSSPWGGLTLSGEAKGDTIEGTIETALGRGTFHLLRVARLEPAVYDQCAGWYRTEGGSDWLVTWDPYGGLKFIDFKNRDEGYWLPESEFVFNAWEGRIPIETTIEFRRENDRVVGLVQKPVRGEALRAGRLETGPYQQRQVTFMSGSVLLGGLLLVPPGPGPHPAVVFVAGSGHQTRERGRELYIADRLLRTGVAVLLYDKSGSGASGGHWRECSIPDLAGDALAGVELLKGLKEIDGARIGLYGVSQGGVVIAEAAAQNRTLAFLVNDSGAMVDFTTAERFAAEKRFSRVNLPAPEIADALEFIGLRLGAHKDEAAWQGYLQALAEARSKTWFPHAGFSPIDRDHPDVRFWARIAGHDPMTSWEASSCPALILYGANDQQVPVTVCVQRLEQLKQRQANRDITVKVFSGGGHTLMDASGDDPFVEGFLDFLVSWTRRQALRE